jgi:hypothetical protein
VRSQDQLASLRKAILSRPWVIWFYLRGPLTRAWDWFILRALRVNFCRLRQSITSSMNGNKQRMMLMNRFRISAITGLLLTAMCTIPVMAQDFVVGPLGYTTYRPVVTYSPIVTTPARITRYSPIITSYASPVIRTYRPVVRTYRPVVRTYRPVVRTYRPVVRTYRPVVRYPATIGYPAPVVSYRPVVRYRVPVTAYQPSVSAYGPMYMPTGSLLVRPKVYVTGQPIRNALRAMAP